MSIGIKQSPDQVGLANAGNQAREAEVLTEAGLARLLDGGVSKRDLREARQTLAQARFMPSKEGGDERVITGFGSKEGDLHAVGGKRHVMPAQKTTLASATSVFSLLVSSVSKKPV